VTLDEVAGEVVQIYALGTPRLETLGNRGGFSGARIWRCRTFAGDFCLRAWPFETIASHLLDIHELMQSARLDFVPAVMSFHDGSTIVRDGKRLWDLTTWMPGRADFHENPTPQRLENACLALATLHRAWESSRHTVGSCPAIQRRLQTWQRSHQPAGPVPAEPIGEEAQRLLAHWLPQVPQWFAHWLNVRVLLQPCLCDIWHDHLLFEGDRLTGLVDYGEVKIDHVAVDLARMLGSLIGDDEERWQAGLAAYRTVRPLSDYAEALARMLDRTGVVLGIANWLRWLYQERREFDDPDAARRRLGQLVERVRQW
jgi:homoserine kinase type II